jgi:hypothetical protein
MAFAQCAKSIDGVEKLKFIPYASQFIKDYDYIFYVSPVGVPVALKGVAYRTNVPNPGPCQSICVI